MVQIHFEDNFAGDFEFRCLFPATTDPRKSFDLQPFNINSVVADDQRIQSWDKNLKIDFFKDEKFEKKASGNQAAGEMVYFQTTLDVDFSENFDVKFYVDRCTISEVIEETSVAKEFDIISGGCLNDLVLVRRHSRDPLSNKSLQFSYKSFSFAKQGKL